MQLLTRSIKMIKPAHFRRLLWLAVVCAQLSSTALAASADSHLKDAEQAFVEKRFHAAEDFLNAAIAKNPTDQKAHLMLARTYVQLLDNKAAEHEYANCIKCNPFSDIGRMAHQETINIGGRSAAYKARPSDDVKTVSKSVDVINREASDLKGDYGVPSRTMAPSYSQPPQPSGAAVSNAVSDASTRAATRAAQLADRRAARAASRAARMNRAPGQSGLQTYVPATTSSTTAQPGLQNAYGQSAMPSAIAPQGMSASRQPGAAQTSAQARIAAHRAEIEARHAARRSRISRSPAGLYPPTPNSASNASQGASNLSSPVIPTASSYNLSDTQVQKMHKQQEDSQHAQYAQDSANNLQRLMSEKQKQNSPKLRALGTNLFVRYYGSHDQDGSTASAPAADPVVEMKAKQMKLGDTK